MEHSAPSVFAHWEGFYVIVGSSAAALTGLMFVVMALVAESSVPRSERDVNAFGTPSVVHLCAVLLVSAVLAAPWSNLREPALIIGTSGVAGLVYGLIVLRRVRSPVGYRPVFEDWLWHVILPNVAYGALLVAGVGLWHRHSWAPYAIGAVALVLLFVGIHNAWDTVAYVVTSRAERRSRD
jgi:hypothetical protein